MLQNQTFDGIKLPSSKVSSFKVYMSWFDKVEKQFIIEFRWVENKMSSTYNFHDNWLRACIKSNYVKSMTRPRIMTKPHDTVNFNDLVVIVTLSLPVTFFFSSFLYILSSKFMAVIV